MPRSRRSNALPASVTAARSGAQKHTKRLGHSGTACAEAKLHGCRSHAAPATWLRHPCSMSASSGGTGRSIDGHGSMPGTLQHHRHPATPAIEERPAICRQYRLLSRPKPQTKKPGNPGCGCRQPGAPHQPGRCHIDPHRTGTMSHRAGCDVATRGGDEVSGATGAHGAVVSGRRAGGLRRREGRGSEWG
jgi:hypothetical protein